MRELFKQLKGDLDELDEIITELRYIDEMDEIDIDELEAEIEEIMDLLNGHLEEIFKKTRKNKINII